MKTKKALGLILVVGLCVLTIVFKVSGINNEFKELYITMPGQEQPEVQYEIDDNLFNDYQQELMVYKFKNHKNHEEKAKLLAKKIGLHEELQYDSKNNKYSKDKNSIYFDYEVDTGYWSFRNSKAFDLGVRNNIPTDTEAIEIAKNIIKEYNIYDERFSNIIVVNQTYGDELSNNLEVLVKDVYFYPTVNGIPVLGISRIIVSIGHEGEIVGICKYYKEYEEYKKVKLKNPKEAFKEVKKGKASNNIDPNAKEAKIKNVQLAYWEDGGGINEQPHLQPVWIFEGESIDDNNEISKFDAIVPAIE